MGQVLNNLRNDLLGSNDPLQRAAGILVWRAIAAEAFKSAIEQNLSHGVAALGFYFSIGRPAPPLQRHAHRGARVRGGPCKKTSLGGSVFRGVTTGRRVTVVREDARDAEGEALMWLHET